MKLAVARPRKSPLRPPPPPEPDSIDWNGVRIHFMVVRSPRRKRTVGLRVLGGQVEVRAPVRTSQQRIREFVQAKGQWVLDKLAQHRWRRQTPPLGYGESAPYRGHTVPITIVPGRVRAVEVSLHDEGCNVLIEDQDFWFEYTGSRHFHLTAPAGLKGNELRDGVREALIAWYRARAAEVLRETVDEWRRVVAPRAKPVVRISNARSQWGSCSADGTLRFSWRCLMLKPYQIDYIAVHELAHLKVRNHSKAFWRVVAKAIADVDDVRVRLRETAKTLPE